MNSIPKTSILQLASKSGATKLSDDAFPELRKLIASKVSEIITPATNLATIRKSKTLMLRDLIGAMELLNLRLCKVNNK